ncbi:hypothetical protein MMC20_003656 [Loxospora ochrophaea]|nr:hypothetical protein [Loxospora ochrophaea]
MRLSPTLLILTLSTLTTAQDQKPLIDNLKAYLSLAKSYLPSSSLPSPVDAGASKLAAKNVTPLTKNNWAEVLTPRSPSSSSSSSSGPDNNNNTWMILITGGNKTCHGACATVDSAFNTSAALLSTDPTSPSLASTNCDNNAILCAIWAAGPPAIWHIQLPSASPSSAAETTTTTTTIHIIPLNSSTVTAQEIVAIHAEKKYQDVAVYEGPFHPFDGYLAKYHLNTAIGYVLFGFSMIPSWGMMLVVSLVSRTMMSRRMAPQGGAPREQPWTQPLGGSPPANERQFPRT